MASKNVYLNVGGGEAQYGDNILDLQVPALMHPVRTGINWFDVAFGGPIDTGVMRSSVTLMTAIPGGGKSTLCMQLADSITRNKGTALYNIGEESEFQVRRAASRLALERGYHWSKFRLVDDVLNHASKIQRGSDPVFVFFDSLKTLDDGFYRDGAINSATPLRVINKIIAWCKQTYNIAIVIGHVTKSGQFEGKQQLKHNIDAHCHIKWDNDKKSETYGKRVFSFSKNRMGPININGVILDLNERGLHQIGEEEVEASDD